MGEMVYILGCKRSGTALLQNLFRCAKDTRIINGEVPPPILFRVRALLNDPSLTVVAKRCGAHGLWGASLGGLDLALINQVAPAARNVSGDLIFEQRDDILPWIDWLENWRDIWHIHIKRDPRDVLTSRAAQESRAYKNYWAMWKNAEAIYHRLGQANPDRTLQVEYEKLVQDPNTVMEWVFETIGLEQAIEDVETWHDSLDLVEQQHSTLRRVEPKINTKSMGRWKKEKKRVKELLKDTPDLVDQVVAAGYDEKNWEKKL
jgi:hypothetical protein